MTKEKLIDKYHNKAIRARENTKYSSSFNRPLWRAAAQDFEEIERDLNEMD